MTMAHSIHARNAHEALPLGIELLRKYGQRRGSRNGPVLVAPGPVMTTYERPRERVIFWPQRDANPFFHFFEALWMLAGRNDVAFLAQFVKRMADYSDDGITLHGAYGARWRNWFFPKVVPLDIGNRRNQLIEIAKLLRESQDERRAVLQMWDANYDRPDEGGKDLPCNTHIYFTRSAAGALDMTVCCRSNDIVWGLYGANAVHFSVLQEYLAGTIGCAVGAMHTLSNNFHAYVEVVEPLMDLPACNTFHPYQGIVRPYDMWDRDFDGDLKEFFGDATPVHYLSPFFKEVVMPLWQAHRAYKSGKPTQKNFDVAKQHLKCCLATDWQHAALDWIYRRERRWQRAQDDGVIAHV